MVTTRILSMLVVFKYLSVQFGPAGFGKLSQVMAIAALFSTFAGGGLFNGLVREVAASKDAETRSAWLLAALCISFFSTIILGISAVLLYFFGTKIFLDDVTLAWVFALIGLAQIATAIGNTALAYLSGLNATKYYALAGILGSAFSVVAVVVATKQYGFSGAVAGSAVFALAPSIFALAFLFFKMPDQIVQLRSANFEIAKVKKLATYSLAMIVAAMAVPAALVYIRSHLGQTSGWSVVGEWQSVARIGDAYIQVFGVLFANFLLPRLSTSEGDQKSAIMTQFVKATLLLYFLGALCFYVLAPAILNIVYSAEFSRAKIYVLPQLIADFFKIVASYFVFRFMALGRPNVQAAGEVIQAVIMVLTFHLLVQKLQGPAAVWSYVAGAACVALVVAALTVRDKSTGTVN